MKKFRFNIGDKVRICAKHKPNGAVAALEHDGEIATVKALCPFTYAYELEEFPEIPMERVG